MKKLITPQEREERAAKIAGLNDALRQNVSNPQGHDCVFMTHGMAELIDDTAVKPFWFDQRELKKLVSNYDDFGEGNDPYHERDFGAFTFKGTKCFWKIDYYAPDMASGSNDPADPSVTARVLTIATMAEY